MTILIKFIEPYSELGGICEVTLTKEEAIKIQKSSAAEINHFVYDNDDKALEDFIAVHWAQIIEVDK